MTVGFCHHGQIQVQGSHGTATCEQHLRESTIEHTFQGIGLFGLTHIGLDKADQAV